MLVTQQPATVKRKDVRYWSHRNHHQRGKDDNNDTHVNKHAMKSTEEIHCCVMSSDSFQYKLVTKTNSKTWCQVMISTDRFHATLKSTPYKLLPTQTEEEIYKG